ncbi:hypothetical protein TNCV_3041491 [Trichonephila clavipes]|nr:hypothetical protein TNCV_3041491 [Trichonephila clavipes]
MTGQRYIDEVLLPHVRLFRGAVGDKFVFMDDNATCHRTLAVQDCLDSEVAGRNYPPTNKNTLIHALTEEWDKLLQQLLDNVVQMMEIVSVRHQAEVGICIQFGWSTGFITLPAIAWFVRDWFWFQLVLSLCFLPCAFAYM